MAPPHSSSGNFLGGVLPGCIMAYSGTIDADGFPVETGTGLTIGDWHVCDGTHGTPDLRGRFVLGASTSHAEGSTGGEETHTLTEYEIPPHHHGFKRGSGYAIVSGGTEGDVITGLAGTNKDYWNNEWKKTALMDDVGGGGAHNNMPPFYALAFIMKL